MSDIILKDANGEDVTYNGVESISVATTDGGTAVYSEGGQSGGLSIKSETLTTSNIHARLTELCANNSLLYITIEAPNIFAQTVYTSTLEFSEGQLNSSSWESYDDVIFPTPARLYGGFCNSFTGYDLDFKSTEVRAKRIRVNSGNIMFSIDGTNFTSFVYSYEGDISFYMNQGDIIIKAYYLG